MQLVMSLADSRTRPSPPHLLMEALAATLAGHKPIAQWQASTLAAQYEKLESNCEVPWDRLKQQTCSNCRTEHFPLELKRS